MRKILNTLLHLNLWFAVISVLYLLVYSLLKISRINNNVLDYIAIACLISAIFGFKEVLRGDREEKD